MKNTLVENFTIKTIERYPVKWEEIYVKMGTKKPKYDGIRLELVFDYPVDADKFFYLFKDFMDANQMSITLGHQN